MTTARDQAIALAGLLMSVSLVDRLAWQGRADEAEQLTVLRSLFVFDPDSAEAVYADASSLRPGLRRLIQMLSTAPGEESRMPLRYAMSVLFLTRRLHRDSQRMAIIRNRLDRLVNDDVVADAELDRLGVQLASIYEDTVSTMSHRVQVSGDPQQLRNPAVAQRIRALLLAAIRAAVLWHQVGGRRWRLLFDRRALLQAGEQLLRA